MQDAKGNDLNSVLVPVTGRAALAPFGSPIPAPSEGANLDLVLSELYKSLGLRTADGAPQWAWEADGEAIEFFEEGYNLPSGLANVTVVMKLAETNPWVREIISGKKPDENGYITFDGGGHATRYVLWTEEAFKNKTVRRRVAPQVTVQSVAEDRGERGAVLGYEVTFAVSRHDDVDNEHFGEWVIGEGHGAAPTPVISGVAPQGASEGDIVRVTGEHFSGAISVEFDDDAIPAEAITIAGFGRSLFVELPAGEPGEVSVVVTTAAGDSNEFTFSRS